MNRSTAVLSFALVTLPALVASADVTIYRGTSRWAALESDGDVYVGSSKVGEIESDGDVYLGSSKIGEIQSDGDIYRGSSKIGEIQSDGDVYLGSSKVGEIESDGDIYVGSSQWGNARSCCRDAALRRQLAAVLVLFEGGAYAAATQPVRRPPICGESRGQTVLLGFHVARPFVVPTIVARRRARARGERS
jgi:hypothetical protein